MLRQDLGLQPKTGGVLSAPVPGWGGTGTAMASDGCGSSWSLSSMAGAVSWVDVWLSCLWSGAAHG